MVQILGSNVTESWRLSLSNAETDLCLILFILTVQISGAPGIMATDSVQIKICAGASPLQGA